MRKKSKYKPRPIKADAVTWVINGFRNISDTGDVVLNLKIKNHEAIESLRRGQATRNDLDILIGAFNVTEALSRMKIGDDYANEIKAGQDALLAIGKRGVSNNDRFILKALELTAINLTMEIHDAQLEVATIADLEKAMDIVTKEIKMRKARPIIEEI